MGAKLYWKSTCTTCRKARSLARELDGTVEELNFAKQPLVKADLQAILALATVAEVLNTRHEVAKANGWKEKPPSKTAFVAAVLEDNNLLRRPIVIRDGKLIVGFDEPALRALLG